LKEQIDNFVREQPEGFTQVLETVGSIVREHQVQAKDGNSVFGLEREMGAFWQNSFTCSMCHESIKAFDFVADSAFVRDAIYTIGVPICSIFIDYNVCSGSVREMSKLVIHQAVSGVLTPEYSCARLMGFCNSPKYRTLDSQDYIDRVLADKPELIKDNDFVNQQYKKINEDPNPRKTVKVLHITDVHLDFDYTPGMNANCKEPLCCREINGPAPTPEDAAGPFGNYNCDLPPVVAEMMVKYIKDMEKGPDLVFWTGDNIAHDIWNQTAHKNSDYTIQITKWIKQHWGDIPVFATPGNHEYFPVNVMNFDGHSELLEDVAEIWKDWMDDEAYELFKQYGFYTMPLNGINNTWDGYRVMVLNTEVCNNMNWYLFSQLSDPYQHLEWIEEQLKKAEENGEKYYILAHVFPGGTDCLNEWSERYRAIVERYQHVILHHLVGHAHKEFFNVITDTTNSSAIGMLHGPGGVTTFTSDNPTFRIYDIDYETGYPVKSHKYYFNITAANEGNPEWKYLLEHTDFYGLEDLSPQSYKDLTKRFLTDPNTATKYYQSRYSRYNDLDVKTCKTAACMKTQYCTTTNFLNFEAKDCLGKKRIDYKNDLTNSMFETLFDPWVEKLE
jgi:sphingomyelin phosphodiesterase